MRDQEIYSTYDLLSIRSSSLRSNSDSSSSPSSSESLLTSLFSVSRIDLSVALIASILEVSDSLGSSFFDSINS